MRWRRSISFGGSEEDTIGSRPLSGSQVPSIRSGSRGKFFGKIFVSQSVVRSPQQLTGAKTRTYPAAPTAFSCLDCWLNPRRTDRHVRGLCCRSRLTTSTVRTSRTFSPAKDSPVLSKFRTIVRFHRFGRLLSARQRNFENGPKICWFNRYRINGEILAWWDVSLIWQSWAFLHTRTATLRRDFSPSACLARLRHFPAETCKAPGRSRALRGLPPSVLLPKKRNEIHGSDGCHLHAEPGKYSDHRGNLTGNFAKLIENYNNKEKKCVRLILYIYFHVFIYTG